MLFSLSLSLSLLGRQETKLHINVKNKIRTANSKFLFEACFYLFGNQICIQKTINSPTLTQMKRYNNKNEKEKTENWELFRVVVSLFTIFSFQEEKYTSYASSFFDLLGILMN